MCNSSLHRSRQRKRKRLLLPGKVERVAARNDLDDLAINRDGIITNRLNVSIEDAKGGVILEKVGGLLNTTSVVDGNDVKRGILASMPAPQEVPADPAEPVYGDFYLCLCGTFSVSSTAVSHLHSHIRTREKKSMNSS